MTATATRERPAPARGGGTLAGTGTLIRFALRRDRTRLPVWLGAITLGTVASTASFEGTYPDEASRQAAAATMNTPAGLAMSGPARYLAVDYTYGAMLAHQMIVYVAVVAALMSLLLVARHTRVEEEAGRAELVRAAVVGRHAHLAAALITVTGANLLLGLLLAGSVGSLGLAGVTWGGSLLFGASIAAVGIVFAAVAAAAGQVTAFSRGATGLGLAVLGVAFALRAVGDIGTDALSWLSPIGWAQRTYAYVDDRWWPLLIALGVAAGLAVVAFALSARRDVGGGLRAPRPGPAAGSGVLTHPLGFWLRQHRGMLIGFAVGLTVLGVMYGSILGEVEEMIANVDVLQDMVAAMGGATIIDSFASMIMLVLACGAAVYVVLAVLRIRSEEDSGRAEAVLATGLSRTGWLASHLTVTLLGAAAVMLAAALGLGLAGAASLGDADLLPRLLGAALAYVPALWVTGGVAVALFGLAPRWSTVAWLVPAYAFVVGYLGQILGLPEGLDNFSPFGHVPQLPAAELTWTPLVLLTLLAAALVATGLVGFRRRDLESN